MRIRRNGAKKKNKNKEEEKKEAVNHDMKFAKNIIVTYDSSEEDRVAKYLTRNLVEEYDRKLAFVMYKQITTKYETWMKLWESSIIEDYTTKMSQIWKFTCSDGYRIIATLQEYFWYKDVSFAALPIFYTVKQNGKYSDSFMPNNHTIEIYCLWYDENLETELKNFINIDLGILTEDKLRPIFKFKVLPKIIIDNEGMVLDIIDNQEYNTISLTVKRKDESNSNSYNTVWMYRDINVYNANGKYIQDLDTWDFTLDQCDLILVKNDKLRKVYSKLGWDEDLPDQINIWEYGVGYKIFGSTSRKILKNMSIFYDRQTDSCYLLCERYYYEAELENIKQVLDQIIRFYKQRKTKIKAPALKLSFYSFKDLNK